MGEKQSEPFRLSFNSSLKVGFQGSRVTSDGGLILVRELDERLGFGELIAQHLTDSRRGKNTQLPLADLLRQPVYSRIAGYEDLNDAERLSQDPAFRLIGSEKIWDRGAALTSRLQSFSSPLGTTRCCCSAARATVWRQSCGPATSTAPTTGKNCYCLKSSGSRSKARMWSSVPTRPSPGRRSTQRWRSGA